MTYKISNYADGSAKPTVTIELNDAAFLAVILKDWMEAQAFAPDHLKELANHLQGENLYTNCN